MISLVRALRGNGAGKHADATTPIPMRRARGQALAEFAIVIPVLAFVIAGIIQFGLIFWSQQTLTQVARDTGRWAATQLDCSNTGAVTSTANSIADNSSLFGFTGSFKSVATSWHPDGGSACPPTSNQDVAWVRVRIDHDIPVFFPFVPGNGSLTTTAEFRMEPEPA